MRTILSSVGRRTVVAVVLVPALVGAGAGCSSSSAGSAHGVRIVAAENFWGSIAAEVAGPDGTVNSIVRKPDADPHDYEPVPQDARAFADAQLVIENGIGYDPWAQKLLDAESASGRVVLDVGSVLGVPDGGNPHQWYSRASVSTFVRTLTADLGKVDPAHAAAYATREHDFETKALAPYDALVRRIRSRFAGTPIGATESIVTPWAQTLGLKMLTPESFLDAVSEGSEPTASDKSTVDEQIRDHAIKVFVFNSQNATPDVQRLVDAARGAGIPVVTVTETLAPEQATFQAWQTRQAQSLYDALVKAAGS